MDSPSRAVASLFGKLCWTTAAGAIFSRRFLPYSVDGVFKQSLLRLFDLAYANKYQLPLLITVAFMALDVRLQIEINVFWDRPATPERDRDRVPSAPRPARAIQQTLQPPAPATDLADSNTSLEVIADADPDTEWETEEDADEEYEDLDHGQEHFTQFMGEQEDEDDDEEGPPLVVQVEFRHT